MEYSFAIVLVCYNRIDSLKRLVDSIQRADYAPNADVTLIFSVDKSENEEIIKYANSVVWSHGKKVVRAFSERQGLRKHILQCGDYTNQYDIVVVLEDDVVVSDSFYHYAYSSAAYYFDDDDVAGISLYSFQKNWLSWDLRFEPMKGECDTYFMRIAQSWGQVWTKKKWSSFLEWYRDNSEFKNDKRIPSVLFGWPESSWLKYHTRYCIETNKFFVYPYYSLSTNCGSAGEHSRDSCQDYQVELQTGKKHFEFQRFEEGAIKYDEFMNRIGLEKYLGGISGSLLVDLYCTRDNYSGFDYLLTTKRLKKTVVKTYSLSYHPIELSIINNQTGDGIYLYDLRKNEKNRKKSNFGLSEYSARFHRSKVAFRLGLVLLKKELKRVLGVFFKK